MFPAVPFFNLPKLHDAIKHALPPTPQGFISTWKEMLQIHRKQVENPDYIFIPELPLSDAHKGDIHAEDDILEREAALTM